VTSLRRSIPFLAVSLAVLTIATVTLRAGVPPGKTEILPPWYCLLCGSGGTADAILNVALFVPLGLALSGAGLNVWRAFLISLLLATAIELAQAAIIPFRYSALGDVLWNTLGGALGAVTFGALPRLLRPTPARAQALSRWALATMVGVVAVTAVVFRPSLPRGHYQLREFDRCIPPVADRGPLLDDIHYGDLSVTRGISVPVAALRREWRQGALRITGRTTPASCEDVLSLVTSAAGEPEELFGLSRGLLGLNFRVRLMASDLRLRAPSVHLPVDYLLLYGSASSQVTGRFDNGRLSLDFTHGGVSQRVERLLTPGYGWALLYPFDLLLRLPERWVDYVWLMLLTFPVGFYTNARARRPGARTGDASPHDAGGTASDSTPGGAQPVAPSLVPVALDLVGTIATVAVAQLFCIGRLVPTELAATAAGALAGLAARRIALATRRPRRPAAL